HAGGRVPPQPQRDLEHHVAVSVAPLEPAVAVAELAFVGREGPDLERGAIEAGDLHQRLGDLLPVRPDVLNRRAAHRAGDARQTLDAGPAALRRAAHQRIPIGARTGADLRRAALVLAKRDALIATNRHAQHQTG